MLGVHSCCQAPVTDMYSMFAYCESLTQLDLSDRDTSSVYGMNRMFEGCSNLESLDITGWDTSSVNDMSEMFLDCAALSALAASENAAFTAEMFLNNGNPVEHGWVVSGSDACVSGDEDYAVIAAPGAKTLYVRKSGAHIPTFAGHSMSLSGKIGVNYYLDITDAQAEGNKVTFSWMVDQTEKTAEVEPVKDKSSGLYKASCELPPAEMTSRVTAKISVGETDFTDTYSCVDYDDKVLTDSSLESILKQTAESEGKNPENYVSDLRELTKSMLDLGARAQEEFGRDTENLADVSLVDDDEKSPYYYKPKVNIPSEVNEGLPDMQSGMDECGLSYIGSSLVLDEETSIKHYYDVVDVNKFSEIKDSIRSTSDIPVELKVESNLLTIKTGKFPAIDIRKRIALEINKYKKSYGPLDYV